MTLRLTGLTIAAVTLALSLAGGGAPLSPPSWGPRGPLVFAAAFLVLLLPGASSLAARAGRLLFDSRRRNFDALLFLAAAGAAAAVSFLLFKGAPTIDDGISSVFQARIFARGRLFLPLPPNAGFFELFCVIGESAGLGRWAGMYPPGWPALLLPGVLLGATWIVNPLLFGSLAVASARLGGELFGERAGRTAGLLCLGSPFLLTLSGTHLSHIATALFSALCLLAVLRLRKGGSLLSGLAAGASWGAAFLCRPVDALVLGLLFAAIPVFHWRESLVRWRAVLAALLAASLAAAALAAFQGAVTGDPFTPGHKVGMGKLGRFGFIPINPGKSHTPAKAVSFSLGRLRVLGGKLAGWPVPLFLLVLVPFTARDFRGEELLLLLCPLALTAVFAFFWYWEAFFPARYLSASSPMLLSLAGRGIVLLHEGASRRGATARRIATALVTACAMFPFAVTIPAEARDVIRRGGDVEHVLPAVVEAYGITNALVFMDSISPGIQDEERLNDFYGTGFMLNSLDLDGDVVYARNSRELNFLLFNAYPGRTYYLYRYHRSLRKAFLYRIVPQGREYCLQPVEPREPDLLLTDSSMAAGECRAAGDPPASPGSGGEAPR